MLLERGANMNVRNHADTGLMHRILDHYLETETITCIKTFLESVPSLINDQDSGG